MLIDQQKVTTPDPVPSDSSRFEVVRLIPEGWVVLSPWIKTIEGSDYRQHIAIGGREKELTERLCQELNRVCFLLEKGSK